ncbi:MAG: hypothetical protein CYPHOPRED_003984, partial [Cyphobasidiales sp. Tagirdzhanova-0007]
SHTSRGAMGGVGADLSNPIPAQSSRTYVWIRFHRLGVGASRRSAILPVSKCRQDHSPRRTEVPHVPEKKDYLRESDYRGKCHDRVRVLYGCNGVSHRSPATKKANEMSRLARVDRPFGIVMETVSWPDEHCQVAPREAILCQDHLAGLVWKLAAATKLSARIELVLLYLQGDSASYSQLPSERLAIAT